MSVAFTNPGGATWQTLLNEITLAYSERRQVLGQSAYTPVAARNVQSAAYWATLQNWVEENCGAFVDPVNGPSQSVNKWMLATFDVESMRAAAGLNPAGFRRLPYGATSFQYGVMQVNDAIGPWIFEDLQKAFSVLMWTHIPASGKLYIKDYFSFCSGAGCVKSEVIAIAKAGYDAAGFIEYSIPDDIGASQIPAYRSGYLVSGADATGWGCTISRTNYRLTFSLPQVNLYSSLCLYGYPFATYAPFAESDGLGLKSEELFAVTEQPYRNGAYKKDLSLGFQTNPADIMPENTECRLSLLTAGIIPHAILKWRFTNCNEI